MLFRTPIKNKEAPPIIPPAKIQGVLRPNVDRVRSEKLPNIRLETKDDIAVTAFKTPKIATELVAPTKFFKCCGKRTDAMIANDPIHKNEKRKKLTTKRILYNLLMPLYTISFFLLT